MTKTLLSFLVAMIMVGTAHAQLGGTDTKPGDSCSGAEEGYIRRNASADRDVSEITLICDGSQWQSAQLAPGLPSLNSSQIWVGNGSNAATAVTMSGDATLSNAGVLNISNDALLGPEISSGSITNSHLAGSIALSKLAVTGTADGSKFLRDDGSWQAVSGADNLGNHTATMTLNLNNNIITGASRIFMNSQTPYPDFWSSTGLIAGTSYGYLGTNGAHRTSLMWNGYRNSGDTWTSLGINSYTNAAGIELGYDGILFEAQDTTPTGNGPATRMKINPTGEVGINKTAVSGRELDVAGEVYATEFFGSGSNLTALNASNLSFGTVATGRLGSGTANATTYLRGDGSWQAISGADNLGNHTATTHLNIGDYRLRNGEGNDYITMPAADDSFRFFSNDAERFSVSSAGLATATSFAGSGANLTALNASNLSSGTVATARLGSGTANSSVFLRGDGTWAAPPSGADNLGAGGSTSGNITINNGSPTITFQDNNHRTGFIHQNSDLMYFLTSSSDNATTWTTNGSQWPMTINMTNDAINIGGEMNFLEGNVNMNTNSIVFGDAVGDKIRWYSNTYGTGIESGTLTSWAGTNHRWRIGGTSVSSGTEEMLLSAGALSITDNAITSSAGTIRDANGGWVRTYGNTGWYNGTHGGGWNMEDSTWLRAYGGKAIYTTNVVRADAGVRTNQVCDTNGANCVAQSSLGGSGGAPAGTWCGMRIIRCQNGGSLSYPSSLDSWVSSFPCNGQTVTGSCTGTFSNIPVANCPSGYASQALYGTSGGTTNTSVMICRKT